MNIFIIIAFIIFSAFSFVQAQAIPVCDAALAKGIYSSDAGRVFVPSDQQVRFALDSNPALLPYLSALGQAFRDNNITVVALLLPTRGMVYGDELAALDYNTNEVWNTYQKFRTTLNQSDFLAPDLLYLFWVASKEGIKPFFKLDHHWTPEAARLTAQEVKNSLRILNIYEALDKSTYTTEIVGQTSYRGSRIGEIDELCGIVDVQDEVLDRYETTGGSSGGGLFGNAAPNVVYLGTSNGEVTLNFLGSLKEELGMNVLKANMIGGATLTAMQNFINSNDYQLDKYRPRFIVWEFNINTTILIDEGLLPFNNSLSYRQLIPSIYGQCSSDNLASAEGQGKVLLDNVLSPSGLPITGSNYYLSISSSNPALSTVDISIVYEDGRIENVNLIRPNRLTSPNRFFLELSDFYEGNVTSIEVNSPDPSLDVNTQICHTGHTEARNYKFNPVNLLNYEGGTGMEVKGFFPPESNEFSSWRWAHGAESIISFKQTGSIPIHFEFAASSPIEGQQMQVSFNGLVIDNLNNLATEIYKQYVLEAKDGVNYLEFKYADWNHGKTTFSEEESKELSVVFSKINLGHTFNNETSLQATKSKIPQVQIPTTQLNSEVDSPQPNATEVTHEITTAFMVNDMILDQLDMLNYEKSANMEIQGLSLPESDEISSWRWAYGSESVINFEQVGNTPIKLELSASSPIEGQQIEIIFNDQFIDTIVNLATQDNSQYILAAKDGSNTLVFTYADWNHGKTTFNENEVRELAVVFSKLTLSYMLDAENKIPSDTSEIQIVDPTVTEPQITESQITEPQVPRSQLVSDTPTTPALSNLSDIALTQAPIGFNLQGFEDIQGRWLLGPEAKVDFELLEANNLILQLNFLNPIEGQSVTVKFNDELLEIINNIAAQASITKDYTLETQEGVNFLSLSFSDWNHNQTIIDQQDPSFKAIFLEKMLISVAR